MTDVKDDVFEVLYCTSYGGFGLSKIVFDTYNDRFSNTNYKMCGDIWYNADCFDLNIIAIVKEIGLKQSGTRFCELGIKQFPVKYRGFLECHEYDGLELWYVNTERYMLQRVLDISDKSKYEELKMLQCEIIQLCSRDENSDLRNQRQLSTLAPTRPAC